MTDAATQSWLDAMTEGPDVPGLGQARASFAASGLPHRRMEDWKYTDIRGRLSEALPAAGPLEAPGGFPALFDGVAAKEICFGNGFWAHGDAMGKGVEALSLGDALKTQTGWVVKALGTAIVPDDQPMLALNTALMRDGACIRVSAGADAGTILLSHEGEAGRQTIRNLIVVEDGATLTLLETHQGGDAAQQIQQVTELLVGKGATVTHIRMQEAGSGTTHLATDIVNVAGEGSYRGFVMTSGAALSRNESFIEFTGENAHAEISGTYMLAGKQHGDITTRINHALPNCTSREVFKGVVADEARGVFQGRIYVARDAQKTDGQMLNKTLLLSPRAEMDAKPELEIYADDVKCAHGATTGQLSDEHLFYLRARGIDEATARGMLIQSFLAEALEQVEDAGLRAALTAHMERWLSSHAGVRR